MINFYSRKTRMHVWLLNKSSKVLYMKKSIVHELLKFILNVFTEFGEFSDKK